MKESLNTLPEPGEESTPEVIREFSVHDKNELLVLLCDSYNQKFFPMLITLARGGDIGREALAEIVGCGKEIVTIFLRKLNHKVPGAVEYKKQGRESKWSGTALTTWLKDYAAKHPGETPQELQNRFAAEQRESQSE